MASRDFLVQSFSSSFLSLALLANVFARTLRFAGYCQYYHRLRYHSLMDGRPVAFARGPVVRRRQDRATILPCLLGDTGTCLQLEK